MTTLFEHYKPVTGYHELAENIRSLMNSDSLGTNIGLAARQKVQEYTGDHCAGKVMQVYREVTGMGRMS